MNVAKQIKTLLQEAELYRSQGLLDEALMKYHLAEGLIKGDEELKRRFKLLDAVSSVSKELHLIRKTMENGGPNHLSVSGFVHKEQEALQRESIPLDFDAFLKQRTTEVRREDNE